MFEEKFNMIEKYSPENIEKKWQKKMGRKRSFSRKKRI